MGKWCHQASSFIFDRIFVKLAGNQDRHKILDKFEFRSDRISHFRVAYPWVKFSIDLLWNLQVQLTFQRLEFFITLFLGTVRPRRLKQDRHGQRADVSCIPESGCCCLFVPLFLRFSFSPVFNIEMFRHTFLGNSEAWKIETWYTHRQWADVSSTVQVKKNPHFLFFSMINGLLFWEKLGEIVENFSRFLQEIQYFLQEIPVFLPEILGLYL